MQTHDTSPLINTTEKQDPSVQLRFAMSGLLNAHVLVRERNDDITTKGQTP